MLLVLIDGFESAVSIGFETDSNGFRISIKQLGDSSGGFSFVMEGECVHPHHDVWLGMVKAVVMNGVNVCGTNGNSEHYFSVRSKENLQEIILI